MNIAVLPKRPKAKPAHSGSLYVRIKTFLSSNQSNMYSRHGLVEVMFRGRLFVSDREHHKMDYHRAYWSVASALDFLMEDGLLDKVTRGNTAYYSWKE